MLRLTKFGMSTALGCQPGFPLDSWPNATLCLSLLCIVNIESMSSLVTPTLYTCLHVADGSGDYDIILYN